MILGRAFGQQSLHKCIHLFKKEKRKKRRQTDVLMLPFDTVFLQLSM